MYSHKNITLLQIFKTLECKSIWVVKFDILFWLFILAGDECQNNIVMHAEHNKKVFAVYVYLNNERNGWGIMYIYLKIF